MHPGPYSNLKGVDNNLLLPPWSCGKVMFLQVSVILFTGGGCLVPRGCLVPGVALSWGGSGPVGGACSQGDAWFRGVPGRGGAWSGDAWSGGMPGPEGALWRPPGRLLLRAVHIPLECILVRLNFPVNYMKMKKIGPGGGTLEICLCISATTNEFMVFFLLHFCRYYQLLVIKCKQFCI